MAPPLSPKRVRAVDAWRLLEIVALVFAGLLLWGFADDIIGLSLRSASWVTTVLTFAALAIVVRRAPRGIWSPSSVFLIILALFHVGLVASYAFGREPVGEIGEAAERWIFRDSTLTALWLMDVAMVGYALGVSLFQYPRQRREPPSDGELAQASLGQLYGAVGSALTIMSVVAWFGIVASRGGASVLIGSYDSFLEQTRNSALIYTDRLAYFGLVLMAAAPPSRLRRAAVVAFVIRALFLFPLGQRAEVLFPTFAALTTLGFRRIPMRASRAGVLAVVLLAAIAAVRDLRKVGVGEAASSSVSTSPLDGLAEMGSSLRPVAEVVFWHDLGDPFDGGATYWAPFDRSIYYVIPGWTRPAAEDDDRLMSAVVMKRSGPIGFSIVAEAYRNFAGAGVFIILLGVGVLLGRIDVWPSDRRSQAAAGMVMTGLLMHIRNAFVPLPAHYLFAFGLLAVLGWWSRHRIDRARRPASGGRRQAQAAPPTPGRGAGS
ncbi:MAG: O-antigen polysaccharide polymerase Wzy [Kofleriaceae bacterium]